MIVALTPFTLLDFPKRLSAIVWFGGCNLRCAYCYNPEFLNPKKYLDLQEVLDFLQKRIGFLDGVVLSGGECSIWGERLIAFASRLKEMGFAIKLDTNASYPEVLQELLQKKLLDYVALDFKAPEDKFSSLCGRDCFAQFERSLMLLMDSNLTYEVRTTFHSELLSVEDIVQMRDWLRRKGYQGTYFVQGFVGEKGSLARLGESDHGELKSLKGVVYRGK